VAVDARGNVYATNRGSDEIVELSSRGRPLATWGTPTLRPARLDNPRGAAVDGRGDVLVVTGSSDDHIETFAPSGQLLADWGPTSGRTAGSRVARAFGSLAVDGHGDVYAADMIHNRLLELSSRGRLLAEWGVQVGAISGVAVDQRGNVYVGDSSTGRVLKLSGSGEVLARWATGPFTAPQHLAVDGQGTMYVTYTGENLVQKFSPTGKLVLEWGGSGRGQLVDTEDVAVDRQGTVYVVDDAAGHVVAFSSRGDLRGVWGSVGSRPGQFSNPSGVAVDARGNVYVTDTGNHRIQRLALGSGGRPSH
jgi:adhesin HecA-like repeat protein